MPDSCPDLNLRPRLAADVETLCEIWEAATRSTHPFLTDQQIAAERANLDEVYFPATRTLVAVLNSTPVGFASLKNDELAGLYVAPNAQRRGIGRALVRDLCGTMPVSVEVYTLNMHGRAVYHRLGFTETGRRTDPDTGFERIQLIRPAPGA